MIHVYPIYSKHSNMVKISVRYFPFDYTKQKYICTTAQMTTKLDEQTRCVQYGGILDGHVTEMKRCNWLLNIGYGIIKSIQAFDN